MEVSYRTVIGYGESEMIINKSRFIAYANRAESEQQALAFIEQIKNQHKDATHNCAAYIVGKQDEYQKADDDGEPTGTAGKPILEVIKKSGLKDTVIVVTRYFGGIKLGAGGLIRAYGKTASAGLKVAGLVDRIAHTKLAVEIDYTFQGFVENNLRSLDYLIQEKLFAQKVTLIVLVKIGSEEVLEKAILDWTSGLASFEQLGSAYADVPVPE